MLELAAFLLIGRLTIYVLQKFPFRKVRFIGKYFKEGKFLAELFECDLCLGVWVFAGLAYLLKVDFINTMFGINIIVFDQFLTGAIASFIVHIFRIGWNAKFGLIEV